MLNDQTACFQRGHCPRDVYLSIISVFAAGFKHADVDGLAKCIDGDGYDFIIAIRNHDTHAIAAACLVEVRCSLNEADIPYLFIYELTTNNDYSRHGFAQQMVHAVDALAFLLRSDTDSLNVWYRTLHGKRLFVGLTVDNHQLKPYVNSLVSLYSRSGLQRRTDATPKIEYTSFSRFSALDWCIDRNTEHYIAMWKEALLPVIYSDGDVNIVKEKTVNSRYFFYAFPSDKLKRVSTHGIVHSKHACLHSTQDDNIYVAPEAELIFTLNRSTLPDHHVFAIHVECASDTFAVHISIPQWFAASIEPAVNP